MVMDFEFIKTVPTAKRLRPKECSVKSKISYWRGINVSAGGTLEGITEKDYQIIKDAGFNSIRQVVNWSAHSKDTPPYTN